MCTTYPTFLAGRWRQYRRYCWELAVPLGNCLRGGSFSVVHGLDLAALVVVVASVAVCCFVCCLLSVVSCCQLLQAKTLFCLLQRKSWFRRARKYDSVDSTNSYHTFRGIIWENLWRAPSPPSQNGRSENIHI